MDLVLELKDFILVCTTITTIVGAFYALKYKSEKNQDQNETTVDKFKEFKDLVSKELKEIDEEIKNFNLHIKELLRKDDAEEKYISRKEHRLIMKNIDDKFELILKAVNKKES